MPPTENKNLLAADKPMRAALYAMAGQLADEKMRDALWRVLSGEDPQPKAVADDAPRQQVLSGAEAAKILNLSRRTISALARSGTIKRASLPGRSRSCGYLRQSVEALLATGS